MEEACRVASEGLESSFAKVLRYVAAEGDFLLQAGIGWRPGLIGYARFGADLASPAGYAFRTGKPVVSNHLSGEDRFRTPAIMAEHGIRRAINVLIGSGDAPAFGVLEVDSGDRSDFTARDISFLQGLANIIAAAVDRAVQNDALQRSEALTRRLFESSPDCVKVLDADGTLQRMNANGLALLEIDDLASVAGRPWDRLWPAGQRDKARLATQAARDGRVGRFEASRPAAGGALKWWDVTVSSRDITMRMQDSEAKDALLRQKDLLMQEVHHRVRNSLQLVHTLLQLQARDMADSAAHRALTEAGQRVMTVAAVHRQLYVGQSVHEADLLPYLSGLLDDLRASLSDGAGGRGITWAAEPAVLSAECLTTLGLIVAELVTNALKYGQGEVKVSVHVVRHVVRIAVEDEGPGFPPDFDPAQSSGLGMRLVISMARGADAVHVDRGAATSRIVVNLPVH
jgi:two-component sensor histidine kinase